MRHTLGMEAEGLRGPPPGGPKVSGGERAHNGFGRPVSSAQGAVAFTGGSRQPRLFYARAARARRTRPVPLKLVVRAQLALELVAVVGDFLHRHLHHGRGGLAPGDVVQQHHALAGFCGE